MVPHSIQPNIPALQCVKIFTTAPFLRFEISSIIGSPCTPIIRHVSISSSTIFPASSQAVFTMSVAEASAFFILSKAQNKLTAVGRELRKSSKA